MDYASGSRPRAGVLASIMIPAGPCALGALEGDTAMNWQRLQKLIGACGAMHDARTGEK
jgi:hypothetical protein